MNFPKSWPSSFMFSATLISNGQSPQSSLPEVGWEPGAGTPVAGAGSVGTQETGSGPPRQASWRFTSSEVTRTPQRFQTAVGSQHLL